MFCEDRLNIRQRSVSFSLEFSMRDGDFRLVAM
jgi:hypothetical protein